MSSEPVVWSEEKSKQLQGQLSGAWAEDTWYLKDKRKGNVYEHPFHFNEFPTASLAVEFKYALWLQFESGYWLADKFKAA